MANWDECRTRFSLPFPGYGEHISQFSLQFPARPLVRFRVFGILTHLAR